MNKKGTTLQLGMIEKEHKGLKHKVEGTLLGKIGTLMDEKGTKMIEKEQKGGNAKNKTYFITSSINLQSRNIDGQKGEKTLTDD